MMRQYKEFEQGNQGENGREIKGLDESSPYKSASGHTLKGKT